MTRPVAAVDIGSNSLYLLVARLDEGRWEYLERSKVSARLAAEIGPDGHLRPEAVERTLSTLDRFRSLAARHDAQLRVIATAALRAARNSAEIRARARRELGVEIELIGGAEEARLTYLGVLHGVPELRDTRAVCVDIGGGSTEVLLGRGGRPLLTTSVAVGSLQASRRWLGPDPVRRAAVKRARREIERRLDVTAFRAHGFERAVGTAGTVQRVTRLANGQRRLNVHRATLTAAEIDDVVGRLARAPTQAERVAMPGMDPDRADSLLGGALILQRLTRALGLDAWTVSMDALRTGLLVDTRERRETDR